MDNQNEEIEAKDKADTETWDFNNPDFKFVPSANHDWRQRGPYLMCKSCDLEHGTYIGIEKIMTGIDENGKPIIKTRKELGMS